MAYFIGNGTVTIGGGSLGRTEQLPSLKLLCVDLCARHLDRLGDLGDIPTEVFIDLLRRAKEKATPAIVKRLQDINERLWCEEVDTAFWKQAVEGHILRRTVPAPGPILVERVNDYKERLNALLAALKDKGIAGDGQGPRDREWARDVTTVFEALEETPVSVGLLKETMIGKAVSPFRKSKDPKIARTAAELVRRWKEAAAAATAAKSGTECASSDASCGRDGGRKCGGGGYGEAGGERSPSEGKQRAVEEGFRCRTWESLYQHLEVLRAEKVRASSKRAREAREREQQKRPKMIVGKSRGEEFSSKTARISAKMSAPPSFAPRSSSSSSGPTSASPFSVIGRGSPSRSPHDGAKKRVVAGGSGVNNKTRDGGSGGGSGGSGGSSGTKKRKGDHYSSGVKSIAELRRQIISDQQLAVPAHLLKKQKVGGRGGGVGLGGGSSGGRGGLHLAAAKTRKFFK